MKIAVVWWDDAQHLQGMPKDAKVIPTPIPTVSAGLLWADDEDKLILCQSDYEKTNTFQGEWTHFLVIPARMILRISYFSVKEEDDGDIRHTDNGSGQ